MCVFLPQVKSLLPCCRNASPLSSSHEENTPRHLRESFSLKAFNDHIPAVKIAGAVVSPPDLLDNIESVCDDLLQVVPDSCISSLMDRMANKTKYFDKIATSNTADPIVPMSVASRTTTTTDASVPGVSTDESDEDSDLDEFLLDAALWL